MGDCAAEDFAVLERGGTHGASRVFDAAARGSLARRTALKRAQRGGFVEFFAAHESLRRGGSVEGQRTAGVSEFIQPADLDVRARSRRGRPRARTLRYSARLPSEATTLPCS